MTTIGTDRSGYFEDPTRCASHRRAEIERRFFSGTTKAIMSCQYPLAPSCFSWTPATIGAGSLRDEIAAVLNFHGLARFLKTLFVSI